ncbi:MAG TPA: MerR family transcriptional regulator [Dermatophilaceae bacterium]|nr:MerR family transcriptional regulator [Dermatophilaceae bacterium]
MSSGRGAARPLRIGAVVDALTEEFPEVTISKIRFLEGEGLLTPQRTPSGYRLYSTQDVERLRYVLRAQRDHFWPLKVIKDSLDALDRGLRPAAAEGDGRPRPPVAEPDPDVPTAAELRPVPAVRLTPAEVREASGLDADDLTALEGFGLVGRDAGGHFGADDLRVATAAAGLAAYGIRARHLRPFRTAADREVGLVEQALAGRPPGRERDAAAADLARMCLALHAALVRGGLGRG